jgi:hypothetical protein
VFNGRKGAASGEPGPPVTPLKAVLVWPESSISRAWRARELLGLMASTRRKQAAASAGWSVAAASQNQASSDWGSLRTTWASRRAPSRLSPPRTAAMPDCNNISVSRFMLMPKTLFSAFSARHQSIVPSKDYPALLGTFLRAALTCQFYLLLNSKMKKHTNQELILCLPVSIIASFWKQSRGFAYELCLFEVFLPVPFSYFSAAKKP